MRGIHEYPLTLISYINYRRKSTEGLSILLFVAAFLGNLFYSLSVLSSPLAWPSETRLDEEAKTFLRSALPFLIGSTRTLCFDVVIVVQGLYYSHHGTEQAVNEDRPLLGSEL